MNYSIPNKEAITEKFSELMLSTSDNIHGFSIGKKIVAGESTEELSVRYYVHKKRPRKALGDHELIPESVEINGTLYKTDVIESPQPQLLIDCLNWNSSTPQAPIPEHRSKQRPLIGGINITPVYKNANLSGVTTQGSEVYNFRQGTLGAIVVDNTTNTLVGLTNSHVVVKDYIYAHERPFASGVYNIYDDVSVRNFVPSGNSWIYSNTDISGFDQLILQDNTNTTVSISGARIGRPKRYIPAATSFPGCTINNKVDGALITLDSSDLVSLSESNLQLNIAQGVANFPFATSQEIDACLGVPIASAGATTGPKDESCGIKVSAINSFITLNINGKNVFYSELVEFAHPDGTGAAVYGGDSGSILLGKISNTWKVIGLVFAGTIFSAGSVVTKTIGYACRIDNVVEALHISEWNGTTNIPVDGPNKGELVSTNSSFKGDFFVQNDDVYYQAGIGTAPSTAPTGNFICSDARFTSCQSGNLCQGYDPSLGLKDHIIEAIYVHSNGNPQYAICTIGPSSNTGVYIDTDHSQLVYLGEPAFYTKLMLPTGTVAPSTGYSVNLSYQSQHSSQLLYFDQFPPTGTVTQRNSLTGLIPSGSGFFEFFLIPKADTVGVQDLQDAELVNILGEVPGFSSQKASGQFIVAETGVGGGTGINPVGATQHPCGGGHACNRADFEIQIDTNITGGYKLLDAELNNAGTNDNGPGPFPYNGSMDRYSSRKITEADNNAIFGTGLTTGGQPLSYSIKIVPASGNNNPHVGITWVRILNPCNEPIYSCCLSVGGGTTAPPTWTPPYQNPSSVDFNSYLSSII